MALDLAAELMLGGTALSSFGVIAGQTGLRLRLEARLGRRDARVAGIAVVRS